MQKKALAFYVHLAIFGERLMPLSLWLHKRITKNHEKVEDPYITSSFKKNGICI